MRRRRRSSLPRSILLVLPPSPNHFDHSPLLSRIRQIAIRRRRGISGGTPRRHRLDIFVLLFGRCRIRAARRARMVLPGAGLVVGGRTLAEWVNRCPGMGSIDSRTPVGLSRINRAPFPRPVLCVLAHGGHARHVLTPFWIGDIPFDSSPPRLSWVLCGSGDSIHLAAGFDPYPHSGSGTRYFGRRYVGGGSGPESRPRPVGAPCRLLMLIRSDAELRNA